MTSIPVAAAIIRNQRHEILIAQRAEPPALKGLWEFPGGKIEDGESAEDALIREIREELAMEISISKYLGQFPYAYPAGQIVISAFLAVAQSDKFQILEHLDVRWVRLEDLDHYNMAPADLPLIQAYSALQS